MQVGQVGSLKKPQRNLDWPQIPKIPLRLAQNSLRTPQNPFRKQYQAILRPYKPILCQSKGYFGGILLEIRGILGPFGSYVYMLKIGCLQAPRGCFSASGRCSLLFKTCLDMFHMSKHAPQVPPRVPRPLLVGSTRWFFHFFSRRRWTSSTNSSCSPSSGVPPGLVFWRVSVNGGLKSPIFDFWGPHSQCQV